jgi:hypothetical protein
LNLNLFEFTEEDLISNRGGVITPGQKEWLAGMGQGVVRVQRFNAWIALGFVLFGSCLTFGLWMSNEDSRRAFFANPINLFVLPVAVILAIGIMALSIFFTQRLGNKLSTPELKAAESKVRLEEDSNGNTGGTTYLVYVGRKKFAFGDDVSSIFQEGEKYRVYYCKAGILEFVLSYEQINL